MLNTRTIVRFASLCIPVIVSVFCFCATASFAQTDADGPFGLSTAPAPQTMLAMTWGKLLTEVNDDLSVAGRCRAEPQACSSPAATRLVAIEKEGEQFEPLTRIGYINRATNLAMRLLDARHPDDEWRSPLAVLARKSGDCKHYAVVKYAALRAAGFAPDDVKIVVVGVRSSREQHAVVAVRPGKHRWLILDNHTLTLVESSKALDHYDPLYLLGEDGVRQFALPARAPQVANSQATWPH